MLALFSYLHSNAEGQTLLFISRALRSEILEATRKLEIQFMNVLQKKTRMELSQDSIKGLML